MVRKHGVAIWVRRSFGNRGLAGKWDAVCDICKPQKHIWQAF